MVVKPCPGCGAMPVPEARFCRSCGTPLKVRGLHETEDPVSPVAQTVPLNGEGRSTEGLAADDPLRSAPETSRFGRSEMENILRRVQKDYTDDSQKAHQERVETATPQTTTLEPGLIKTARPNASSAGKSSSKPAQAIQPASSARARRLWQVAAVALLCVALVAGVLAFVLSRRVSSSDAGSASPISISDQKQLVGEKLAEAETLLASGEFNHAIEVLRAAEKLDPSNAEVHMRLGKALERTGARSEAIEEYRAAVQNSPNEVESWRALASAQFEEKLYNDAAESYRRLLTVGGNNLDDATWLAYADALRLAGRTEEARAAYQKISSSTSGDVAQRARQHLAQLGPPPNTVSADHAREDARKEPGAAAREAPAAKNKDALTDPDSYYFKGVNLVNGRDPKKLSDGELAAALNYFLRAQGGTHSAEAKRNADNLGKEYDRRRKR